MEQASSSEICLLSVFHFRQRHRRIFESTSRNSCVPKRVGDAPFQQIYGRKPGKDKLQDGLTRDSRETLATESFQVVYFNRGRNKLMTENTIQ